MISGPVFISDHAVDQLRSRFGLYVGGNDYTLRQVIRDTLAVSVPVSWGEMVLCHQKAFIGRMQRTKVPVAFIVSLREGERPAVVTVMTPEELRHCGGFRETKP